MKLFILLLLFQTSNLWSDSCSEPGIIQSIFEAKGGCSPPSIMPQHKDALRRYLKEVSCCGGKDCTPSDTEVDYVFELYKNDPEMQKCLGVDYVSRKELGGLKCERDYIKRVQGDSKLQEVIMSGMADSISELCRAEQERRLKYPKIYGDSSALKQMYDYVAHPYRNEYASKAPTKEQEEFDQYVNSLRGSIWNHSDPAVQELVNKMISESNLGGDPSIRTIVDCRSRDQVQSALLMQDFTQRRPKAGYAPGENEKYMRPGAKGQMSFQSVLGKIRERVEKDRIANKSMRGEDIRLYNGEQEVEIAFKASNPVNCYKLFKTSYISDLARSRSMYSILNSGTTQEKNDKLQLFGHVVCDIEHNCADAEEFSRPVTNAITAGATLASIAAFPAALGAETLVGLVTAEATLGSRAYLSVNAARAILTSARVSGPLSLIQDVRAIPELFKNCFEEHVTTFGKNTCEAINNATDEEALQIERANAESGSCVGSVISSLAALGGGVAFVKTQAELAALRKVMDIKHDNPTFMRGLGRWLNKNRKNKVSDAAKCIGRR